MRHNLFLPQSLPYHQIIVIWWNLRTISQLLKGMDLAGTHELPSARLARFSNLSATVFR
jgi:hypothetical protein